MNDPLVFRPYSPSPSDIVYRDNLPHRSRAGRTFFVTWRLSDSLPPRAEVDRSIRKAQQRWLRRRGLSFCPWTQDVEALLGRISPEKRLEYRLISFHVRERFDPKRLGSCALGHRGAVEAVRYAVEEELAWGCGIGDLVICFNHAHLLLVPGDDGDIRKPMQRIKGRASRYLGLASVPGLPRPIWQRSWFDHGVRTRHKLEKIRNYIANHPVPCREALRVSEWS